VSADHTEELQRELGFWDALTIGVGTMIGAGIFLLAGVAVELTGPAAIFSFLVAAVVCLITAASVAELATGMPTSGGDYYFISRSLGPAFGAISGIGVWLSLTVAIAFYLVGLGEFVSQLVPVPPLVVAAVGGIALTALNVIGAKESGRTQLVVVFILLAILAGFIVLGVFHLTPARYTPFFPFGAGAIMPTTALVFVSFLGFVKIAAVAEEIREPHRNLPRTLIGSVLIVTVLYVTIVLIIAGIFDQSTIVGLRDPLTAAARFMLGGPGAIVVIFAGLLATVSSANASILASSRINLAMSRDAMFPAWLARIHHKLLTPYRAILLTGILALCFLVLEDLEDLAKIASSLQLYAYAALNIGCVALRIAAPDWYRPSFRTPGFPYAQVLAALACVAIILYSGPFAQIAVALLIIISLAFYVGWAQRRVDIEHGLPQLRSRLAENGIAAALAPKMQLAFERRSEISTVRRDIDPHSPRDVLVALANPEHEADLLKLGRLIATGREEGGTVWGVHFVPVPRQTPLEAARESFDERGLIEREIVSGVERSQAVAPARGARPLPRTSVGAVTDVAHDVFAGLINEANRRGDLLLMGWQGGFSVGRIYNSPLQRVMAHVDADLAVLKDRGLDRLESIAIPWGGGSHARLGLEIAIRIADAVGARVDLLRVVGGGVDADTEREHLRTVAESLGDDLPEIRYHIQHDDRVAQGILSHAEQHDSSLIVIGASRESVIRNVLFGSIPDVIADGASCSVLMVRRQGANEDPVPDRDRLRSLGDEVEGSPS
jgi:amino acid transporter/nucleotide-binding universal stress UspA family protein